MRRARPFPRGSSRPCRRRGTARRCCPLNGAPRSPRILFSRSSSRAARKATRSRSRGSTITATKGRMKRRLPEAAAFGAALIALAASVAFAQGNTADEIAKYREALQDGNPAELWEARGEELWKTPRGPRKVAFTACDLGLGADVVKGAYAQLPRYFADADRVMDLESRLVWCMVEQQGYTQEEATRVPFGDGSAKRSDLEALAAYVVGQSRGVPMHVSLDHPKMKTMYALGEKMFFYRGGTHDFACAT